MSSSFLARRETGPFGNPSYPKRIHFNEQQPLRELLASWDQKIASVAEKLRVLGESANRSGMERLYHQALGARDQLAECACRIPREAGELYEEDHERLRITRAALERLAKQWESAGI